MSMLNRIARWACVVALAACIVPADSRGQDAAVDLQQAKTAIVALETSDLASPLPRRESLRRPPAPYPTSQTVTGFRVGSDGETLTVSLLDRTMRDSDSLRLIAGTGEPQPVNVVAWDPASGLAALRAAEDGQSSGPAAAGDVATLSLSDASASWGAPVHVLSHWRPGSPAISVGVVSTEPRFDPSLGAEIFQTDATVHPGSRGGPVLNDGGQVTGIITAMRGTSDAEGAGTAVEVAALRRLTDFVRTGGRGALPKPRLGLVLRTTPTGVVIRSVIAGSPAQQAGVQTGDRIVAIDQQDVREYEDVLAAVTAKRPGDELQLTVERDGQTEQLTVTLDQVPPQEAEAGGPPPVTLYDPPTIILPGGRSMNPETLRQWLQQHADGLPELPTAPTRIVPAPGFELDETIRPQVPDTASPANPPLSDELSKKLDAFSEQLRELTRQVQELQKGRATNGQELD